MIDTLEHEVLQIIIGYLNWQDVKNLRRVIRFRITDPTVLDKHHLDTDHPVTIDLSKVNRRSYKNYIQFRKNNTQRTYRNYMHFRQTSSGIMVYIYSIAKNLVYIYHVYKPPSKILICHVKGGNGEYYDELFNRKHIDVLFNSMIKDNPIIKKSPNMHPMYNPPPGFLQEIKYYI